MKFNLHFVKENPIWAEKEYDVGETVWIVKDWLVIKCTIIAVEDYFRKKDPNAYLFYDVDEPIGHSLPADELFNSKEEAATELVARFIDNLRVFIEDKDKELALGFLDNVVTSLKDSRESTIKFIAGTHAGKFKVEEEDDELVKEKAGYVFEYFENMLREKEKGMDWFNLSDFVDLDAVKKFIREDMENET